MYTADDFNTENAPKEMVQYVIDNVEGFESRYMSALSLMRHYRCPLSVADYCLFEDIEECIGEWCHDNEDCSNLYDIEEIFG